jgi:hypothetical protein
MHRGKEFFLLAHVLVRKRNKLILSGIEDEVGASESKGLSCPDTRVRGSRNIIGSSAWCAEASLGILQDTRAGEKAKSCPVKDSVVFCQECRKSISLRT